MIILILATILFIVYSCGEPFASIARHAGATTGHHPLGLMLANQIYSVNRLSGFIIAPLLGLYVDMSGSEQALKYVATIGCIISGSIVFLILVCWRTPLAWFSGIIVSINHHGFTLSSLTISRALEGKEEKLDASKLKLPLAIAQGLSTALAMPAIFILNILAIRYPTYTASIVQSTTVISGAGNLILNFYVMPVTALAESRGDPDYAYYSAMVGKIFGLGIIGPCILLFV